MKHPRRSRRAANDPPPGLSPQARAVWRAIVSDFMIHDAGGQCLVEEVCRAYDRLHQARAAIAKQGLTVVDRFGQRKINPCCVVERDASARLQGAIRALRLEPASTGIISDG